MTETVITVRGEYTSSYPAERAILSAAVAFDGEDRESVLAWTSREATNLREALTVLKASGAITTWSSERLQVWSDRPWNSEGEQLALVTHATLGFRAVFSDFDALSDLLTEHAATDGVRFEHIDWELTDATRTMATAEVRSRAVKDAVAKATVFAQSIGLGSVRATALADPGMLGDQGSSSAEPMMYAASARIGKVGGNPELRVTPDDIEVTALVDARFLAA